MKNKEKKPFKLRFLPAWFGNIVIRLAVFILVTLILGANLYSEVRLKVGQVSTKDIIAPKSIEIIDEQATQEARQKAADSISPVYYLNPNITLKALDKIEDYFVKLSLIKKNKNIKQLVDIEQLEGQLDEINKTLPLQLSKDSLLLGLSADPKKLSLLKVTTTRTVWQVMQKGIKKDELEHGKTAAKELINQKPIAKKEKEFVLELTEDVLEPNSFLDWETTVNKQQEAMSRVQPVKITIQKNETVIRRGVLVTSRHIKILEALSLSKPIFNIYVFIGTALLVLLFMFLIEYYLAKFNPEVTKSSLKIIIIYLVIIADLILVKSLSIFSGYITPIAAVGMLFTILLDYRFAIYLISIVCLMTGLVSDLSFSHVVVSWVSSFVGILSILKVEKRADLVRGGIIVSLVNVLMILAFGLSSDKVIFVNIAYGVVSGLASAIITIGTLPFLENAFGTTTSIKLLEISNPSEPLLKRLLIEAPGTYHHSVLCGNLAESAANAIKADPLLARVGAYYHDIGKIKRPYLFIENQLTSENPHNKLTPRISSQIIINHVADGVELANTYNLPLPIIDIIRQHHGISVIKYFYHQALKDKAEGEKFDEKDFHYTGPKPQKKEAAIVMLADIIEATAKTLTSPTPEQIDKIVKDSIKEALFDGQLDDCELSLSELNAIAEAFIRSLNAMFHHRVEYPEKIVTDTKIQEFFEH